MLIKTTVNKKHEIKVGNKHSLEHIPIHQLVLSGWFDPLHLRELRQRLQQGLGGLRRKRWDLKLVQ